MLGVSFLPMRMTVQTGGNNSQKILSDTSRKSIPKPTAVSWIPLLCRSIRMETIGKRLAF